MVKKTDIALLLALGIVGFILFSQLKNIQFPSFEFPKFPSITPTVTQLAPSDFLAKFDPFRSIIPLEETRRIQQEAPSFNVFDSVKQAIQKITTGGFSSEFVERVAAISPVTQSGQFVQQVDVLGRPIRSIF